MAAPGEARSERPEGPLIWLHVAGQASASGIRELGTRLIAEKGVSVLITAPEGFAALPGLSRERFLYDRVPDESSAAIRAFLAHWRPEAAVFSEGEIRPTLIHEAVERRIALMMVDAREPWLPRGRETWFPGVMRRSLAAFSRVYAIDGAAGRAWRRGGAVQSRVLISGRLEESSQALPCLEAEREYLARLVVARPVWFAAGIPEAEETAVAAAHRHCLQMAHRLLQILMPQDPTRGPALAAALEEAGFAISVRSDEQEPDAETEVYIVTDPAELGLWYRLAPVTYLGGGLSGTGLGLNPFAPAALGSALLHGPRPGDFGAPIGRLGAARAARAVASVRDLSEALGDLLAPDRTARLAQAAWGVVSEGAEATEDILRQLRVLIADPVRGPSAKSGGE